MKIQHTQLQKLSHGQSSILILDCEFWHVFGHKAKGYSYVHQQPFFFMPREIGAILLRKTKEQWSIKKMVFATFYKPNLDVAFPISNMSSVTEKTGRALDELDDQLSVPWGEAYYSGLSESDKDVWNKGIQLYENDPIIKRNHQPPSWLKSFLKVYSESTVILKGVYDIECLKNACKYYGFSYLNPKHIVDIAEWNSTSHLLCNTAKLDKTFECIEKKLSSETKQIVYDLPIGDAHNPVSDAAMTLIIALHFMK